MVQASLMVVCAGQLRWKRVSGARRRLCPVAGSAGSGTLSGTVEGNRPSAGNGDPAMTATVSVTVRQVREDGTEGPLEEELAAALAGPVGQFTSMLAWTVQQAAPLDHGDRENVIADSGRELQRKLLESTFTIACAQERRIEQVTSGARNRQPPAEKDHDRRVTTKGVPARPTGLAFRSLRQANLCPAGAKWIL